MDTNPGNLYPDPQPCQCITDPGGTDLHPPPNYYRTILGSVNLGFWEMVPGLLPEAGWLDSSGGQLEIGLATSISYTQTKRELELRGSKGETLN